MGAALHEGADRGLVQTPEDEVTVPVPDHLCVSCRLFPPLGASQDRLFAAITGISDLARSWARINR